MQGASGELNKAKAKLAELKKMDPGAELAAARLQLERLDLALQQTKFYGLRERKAALLQQGEIAEAARLAAKKEIARVSEELKQASDPAARDQLKTALQKAEADATAKDEELKRIRSELKAVEDQFQLNSHHWKTGSDVSRL